VRFDSYRTKVRGVVRAIDALAALSEAFNLGN